MPSGAAPVSSALVTVVPTAMIRRPAARECETSSAVGAGIRNHSRSGASPASSEETPVCRVIGVTSTPPATSEVTRSVLNGRPALGISALPGSRANTVWYALSGHDPVR